MHNPITGEVYDLTNNQDLLDAYRDVKQMESSIKKMKDEIQHQMMVRTADSDICELTPQFQIKKQLIEVSTYPMGALRQYFDEDTLALITKPVLKEVKEQAKQLSREDRKALEASKVIERSHYTYKITEI